MSLPIISTPSPTNIFTTKCLCSLNTCNIIFKKEVEIENGAKRGREEERKRGREEERKRGREEERQRRSVSLSLPPTPIFILFYF
jgi:hypothetical protein